MPLEFHVGFPLQAIVKPTRCPRAWYAGASRYVRRDRLSNRAPTASQNPCLENRPALRDLVWAVSRKQAAHVRAAPKNTMVTWDCTPVSTVEWRTERFNDVLRIASLIKIENR